MAPIRIKKKNTTPASNKTETLPENPDIPPSKVEPSQPLDPYPFIDKISIIVSPDKQRGQMMYSEFFSDIDQKRYLEDGPKPKGEYQICKRIVLKSANDQVKRYPLLQIRYSKAYKEITRFRLEFVPVDLGSNGMAELHIALGGWIKGGWDYVRKHGKVTRLDVTFDLPDINMESFLLLYPQGVSSRTWSVGGKLQTIVLGKKKGNQTIIYDRGAKRKAQGQLAPDKQGVRVEC